MDVLVDNEQTKQATVRGVPLSAFTCWQHGCIDVVTLSRVGTFMRRGAIQHGFIDADFFKYRPEKMHKSVEVSPESQQAQPSPSKTRFFVISCDIVMNQNCPRDPTGMRDVVDGTLFVSNISNSTFGLYLDMTMRHGSATSAADPPVSIGFVHITYVCISDRNRRSTPLEPYRRALLERTFDPQLVQRFHVEKIERLGFPPGAVVLAREANLSEASAAKTQSDDIFFRHPMPVRDADTDFNGHLNQSMYIAFVVDAVKALMRRRARELGDPQADVGSGVCVEGDPATGEDADVDQPNTYTGVSPFPDATSSKIVRRFRIDYIKEVPSRAAQLTISLARLCPRRREAAEATEKEQQQKDASPASPQLLARSLHADAAIHRLWFQVTAEVPERGSDDEGSPLLPRYLAAQGLIEVHSKWL